MIGLLNASPATAACEIGFVTIFPPFQRSYVSTHAIGLLLHYLLDLPRDGGLGLRRVVWQTHSENERSRYAAERMGFRFEGVNRWVRGLGREKAGEKVEELDEERGKEEWEGIRGQVGRHSMVLSVCWDDWEGVDLEELPGGEAVRETVERLMAR